jgi:hypothetical protein
METAETLSRHWNICRHANAGLLALTSTVFNYWDFVLNADFGEQVGNGLELANTRGWGFVLHKRTFKQLVWFVLFLSWHVVVIIKQLKKKKKTSWYYQGHTNRNAHQGAACNVECGLLRVPVFCFVPCALLLAACCCCCWLAWIVDRQVCCELQGTLGL